MHESIVAGTEKLVKTGDKNIMVLEAQKNGHDIFDNVKILERIVERKDMDTLIKMLKYIIPNYTPSQQVLGASQKGRLKGDEEREDKLWVALKESV